MQTIQLWTEVIPNGVVVRVGWWKFWGGGVLHVQRLTSHMLAKNERYVSINSMFG